MEELVCKECKGRKFRKISETEYECEYCGAISVSKVETEHPKVVIVQQQPQPQVIVTPFPPEISYNASLREGLSAIGGKLVITPDKFVFAPHSFNIGSGNLSPREWKIVDIASFVKGSIALLDIKMSNDNKIKLSVNNKSTIIRELEARRKFWLEKNDSETTKDAKVSSSFGRIGCLIFISLVALFFIIGFIGLIN